METLGSYDPHKPSNWWFPLFGGGQSIPRSRPSSQAWEPWKVEPIPMFSPHDSPTRGWGGVDKAKKKRGSSGLLVSCVFACRAPERSKQKRCRQEPWLGCAGNTFERAGKAEFRFGFIEKPLSKSCFSTLQCQVLCLPD